MRATVTVEVEPVIDEEPRCIGLRSDGRPCRKQLAEAVARPWSIRCPRCGTRNTSRQALD